MKHLKLALCFIAWAMMSGCAAMLVNDLKEQEKTYWAPLLDDPDLVALNKKVWLKIDGLKERPLRYYEIHQYPTTTEKQALKKLYGYNLGWQEIFQKTLSKYSRAYNDIVSANFAAANNLRIELIMGKLTYGEYALNMKHVNDKAKEALLARDNQVMAQQAVLFNQYLLNQQLINAMNQPAQVRPFTCTRAGGGTYLCR